MSLRSSSSGSVFVKNPLSCSASSALCLAAVSLPDGVRFSASFLVCLTPACINGAGPATPPINSEAIPKYSLPGSIASAPALKVPAPNADVPSIAAIFPGELAVDFTTLLKVSRIIDASRPNPLFTAAILPGELAVVATLGTACIAACAGFTLLAAPKTGAAIPVACPIVLPPRANARWSIGNSCSSR